MGNIVKGEILSPKLVDDSIYDSIDCDFRGGHPDEYPIVGYLAFQIFQYMKPSLKGFYRFCAMNKFCRRIIHRVVCGESHVIVHCEKMGKRQEMIQVTMPSFDGKEKLEWLPVTMFRPRITPRGVKRQGYFLTSKPEPTASEIWRKRVDVYRGKIVEEETNDDEDFPPGASVEEECERWLKSRIYNDNVLSCPLFRKVAESWKSVHPVWLKLKKSKENFFVFSFELTTPNHKDFKKAVWVCFDDMRVQGSVVRKEIPPPNSNKEQILHVEVALNYFWLRNKIGSCGRSSLLKRLKNLTKLLEKYLTWGVSHIKSLSDAKEKIMGNKKKVVTTLTNIRVDHSKFFSLQPKNFANLKGGGDLDRWKFEGGEEKFSLEECERDKFKVTQNWLFQSPMFYDVKLLMLQMNNKELEHDE